MFSILNLFYSSGMSAPRLKKSPWPRFWVDNFHGLNYNLTWQEKRNKVLSRVENSGFGWWIVLVAGVGFFTDSYDIFVVNTIIPMLGTVYFNGHTPKWYSFGINVATLVGSMIGQVAFGVLADRYGRRRMYGWELVVTITATLGFATPSTGAFHSMSIIGLLIVWRLAMAIGIGADYPLSAVIVAEFAATKHRASMIAAVFFCQPFGQLFAALMAFAATTGLKSHILQSNTRDSCTIHATDPAGQTCAQTVDRAWRLVAGLGAVPALVAMVFRLTIPESVYYLLDIGNDSNRAMQARKYFPPTPEDVEFEDLGSPMIRITPNIESRDHQFDAEKTSSARNSFTLPPAQSLELTGALPSPAPTHVSSSQHHDRDILGPPAMDVDGRSPPSSPAGPYLGNVTIQENPHQIKASWDDFKSSILKDGNWTDLFSTSVNWMLLDFCFYLLGVNSSRFVPDMFGQKSGPGESPYDHLVRNQRHIMLSTSIGAVLGGALAIKVMNIFSRKKIQMWAFLILGCLFAVVGVMYITLIHSNSRIAIIVIFALCQFFFNLGPNTTTFIIPAEAFPTRYRCTCHGISAAAGKFGSVLGQIVVTLVTDQKGIGGLLASFAIVMLLGALITHFWTPETCDIRGRNRKLEDLAKGKKFRREMDWEERRGKNENGNGNENEENEEATVGVGAAGKKKRED